MTKLIDVEVTYDADGRITVTPVWSGVDRPRASSWGLGARDKGLAERLVRAIKAGVVFTNICVKTDENGKTFVSENCLVRSRCLNADLKRLGY